MTSEWISHMAESKRYGKWEVIKPIGRGGQGQVYLARDTSGIPSTAQRSLDLQDAVMGTINAGGKSQNAETAGSRLADEIRRIASEPQAPLAALKELLPLEEGAAEDEAAALDRMNRELSVLKSVDHPALVKVLDSNLDQKWFAMEFFEGGTLSEYLGTYKGRVLDALRAFRSIVAAVSALHVRKVVHRDIKPDNIFVASNGNLVLADCGLAFRLESQDRLTMTFENVGTRDFQPPWSYGMRLADVRPNFDVFSLAKVLWTMVSGRPKFPLWYLYRDEDDLRQMFPDEPAVQFVHEIVRKCAVQREDEARLRDAAELLGEVDTMIAALSHGCQLPGLMTKMRCRFCGIGTYERTSTYAVAANLMTDHERTYFLCDHCGHLESFLWPIRKPPPAWDKSR